MGYFYPGYDEARQRLSTASLGECMSTIDALFGRENILEDETNIEEVRDEALRQLKEEFTDKSSPEYDQVQFWVKVGRVGVRRVL